MTSTNFGTDWGATPSSRYVGYTSDNWDPSIGAMAHTSTQTLVNAEVTYNYQAQTYDMSAVGSKLQFSFDNHFHANERSDGSGNIDNTSPVNIGIMDVSDAGSSTFSNSSKAIYLKGTVDHGEWSNPEYGWRQFTNFELVYGNSSITLANNLIAGGYVNNGTNPGDLLSFNYDLTFENVGNGNLKVDIDMHDYHYNTTTSWSQTVANPFGPSSTVAVAFGSEALNATRNTGIHYDTDAITYTVPEPSSSALLALAAFSALGFRRRK